MSLNQSTINAHTTPHLFLVPLHSPTKCTVCGRPLAGDEAKRFRGGYAHVACTDVVAGPRGT
jgi:hypothetical protein